MKCPRCQQENPSQAKFCLECGVRLAGDVASDGGSSHQTQLQIENLSRALAEAAEQQAASAEILKVISSSPSDVQPVFDAIAKSAARLCDGIRSIVYRLDGDIVRMVAHYNARPEGWAAYQALYPRPLNRQTNSGRAMLDGRVAITEDVETDPERSAAARDAARLMGTRSAVTVPLLHEGRTIGALTVARDEPGPFSPKQVALLQTFADQAVIATDNVRLFKELEARNRDLTATSEILQVIASSPTDVQPVFDTIMRSIVRLCGAKFCVAYRHDGEHLHMVAHDNLTLETLASLNARYPQPPSRETATGISTLERRIVHIPDSTIDDLPPASREFARQQGWGTSEAASRIWQPRTGSQRCTN
jgi:two-component system, NtrC family, sensor kinase